MKATNPPGPSFPVGDAPHPTGGAVAGSRRWAWLSWSLPALIVAGALVNGMRIGSSSDLDSMTKNLRIMLTAVVCLCLLLVWWLFLSRLRWRTRLAGLAAAVLLGVGLTQLVRIDGSANGNGRPRLVWKWSPRKSGEVQESSVVTGNRKPAMVEEVADYPGYLGGDRSGVVAANRLDSDWATRPPEQLWRRPVGLGWSGFAVAGSVAITQEQRGPSELVVCYELATGRLVWSHTNQVRFSEPMGGDGPRTTPTIEHGRVYALGATGILDCLDVQSGKLLWTHDTLKENSLPNVVFGKCSSPLVVDDLVVVTGGMAKRDTLLAFRCADGTPAWKAGNDEASYCSPVLATLGGRRQILSANATSLTAHDPKDGHVLWQYPWARNQWPKCAQPVLLDGNHVLLSASFNVGCVLLEVKGAPDGTFAVSEVWKNRNMKSEFSNLVSREGYLYGLDDGILACLDLATGRRNWKDGRYGHGQVLLVGDLLLVQTERGPVTLVDASPSGFRELARLDALHAKTWNTPALAGGLLLVRNDQEAVCYRLPKRALPGPKPAP